MQAVIQHFLFDLKREIVRSKVRKDIVSVVLIGSAARGDWVRGKSDVDFLVVARSGKAKGKVGYFFRKTLQKLNRKHQLRLEESCTDRKKFHNAILNEVLRLESGFLFGVPYYVISQEDFDLAKRKVSDRRVWLMMTFVGSLSSFLRSIKQTGRTVYGEDLVKEIRSARLGFSDRVKIFLVPYYILGLGFLSLHDGKSAINHAIKACLLECDDDLMLLEKRLGSYERDEKLYEKLFSRLPSNTAHIRKCIRYRKDFSRINPSLSETLSFLFRSLFFVLTSHFYYVLNLAAR
ncbi:MAG: nucleotidyltransferase domain-containing protein [Candidatus Aenigmarchaeota archaeon]|nr:nucleotidyltransferase domain-containing protein [Candidatus Aenigmarchaeota archaeon]